MRKVQARFDDASVADYFDLQVERGLKPEGFARIWWHTHPGQSAHPSSLDETTFARVFARADWAMMFIIARGGERYARLRFSAGPGGSLKIPIEVEYRQPFPGTDFTAWESEYRENVVVQSPFLDGQDIAGDQQTHLAQPGYEGLSEPWSDHEQDSIWEELTFGH